jgi:hypothetical protein
LDLDRRLDDWTNLAPWRHLSALALVALVAAVRWHHCVLSSDPLIDEATYLEAFRAVLEGRSAYEVVSYHYTPFFASVGGGLLSGLGELGTLGVLRVASLLGLAIAIWCSFAWLDVSWWRRLALAVGFVALAPSVGAGLCTGNISFAVIGLILLALVQWSRRSPASGAVPSGLALGATVAAKPLAPLALVALFLHRPTGGHGAQSGGGIGRRHQIAGLVGGLTATALILPMVSRLAEMSEQPIHPLSYARSFSLQRVLSLAGIEVSALAIVLAGVLALAVLLRFLALDRSQLLAVAVTASVLVTPIIWNHTLVMTLPVQVMALVIAAERWRVARGKASRNRSFELVFVALGALAMQFSEGFGAVDELSRGAQLAFLAVPYFAPALLAAYLLVFTGSIGGRRGLRNR